jgi:hypothetical protein
MPLKWSDKKLEAAIQRVEFCLSMAVEGSRDQRELWERLDVLVMEQNRRENEVRLRGKSNETYRPSKGSAGAY